VVFLLHPFAVEVHIFGQELTIQFAVIMASGLHPFHFDLQLPLWHPSIHLQRSDLNGKHCGCGLYLHEYPRLSECAANFKKKNGVRNVPSHDRPIITYHPPSTSIAPAVTPSFDASSRPSQHMLDPQRRCTSASGCHRFKMV